jgi:hypothetical protein
MNTTEEMTPSDAFNLMNQVCEKWVGTRADHQHLQEALAVLGRLVEADTSTQPASVSDKDLGIEGNGENVGDKVK